MEPRAAARAFVLGLLSAVERKNCWGLAEQAGHTGPDAMQRLVRSARWDAEAVRDEIRSYVVDHLGTPDGVLIVDETGFLKEGRPVGLRPAAIHRHGGKNRKCPLRTTRGVHGASP